MWIVSTRATGGLVDAIAAAAARIGALEQLAGGADAGAPTDEPLGLVPGPLWASSRFRIGGHRAGRSAGRPPMVQTWP